MGIVNIEAQLHMVKIASNDDEDKLVSWRDAFERAAAIETMDKTKKGQKLVSELRQAAHIARDNAKKLSL